MTDDDWWIGIGLGVLLSVVIGLLLIFLAGGGWAILGWLFLGGAALLLAFIGYLFLDERV
ncbi:MAG TPA: hypothetical protein DGG94_08005 [Micromonosporaceae bacterium]|nr:hypothetical protein [Micromonosporaceae bacterium]HCU49729.1 hypothetical protein [Micromonosporaceae bacterium]